MLWSVLRYAPLSRHRTNSFEDQVTENLNMNWTDQSRSTATRECVIEAKRIRDEGRWCRRGPLEEALRDGQQGF